jgi:uncharacterized membrane protein
MRGRAAIGNHPIHPALVAIPIGAFFVVLVDAVVDMPPVARGHS